MAKDVFTWLDIQSVCFKHAPPSIPYNSHWHYI